MSTLQLCTQFSLLDEALRGCVVLVCFEHRVASWLAVAYTAGRRVTQTEIDAIMHSTSDEPYYSVEPNDVGRSSAKREFVMSTLNRMEREQGIDLVGSRHIQGAVRWKIPGELAKHAVSEGTKAVTKFTSARSGSREEDDLWDSGDVDSWSAPAGLQFAPYVSNSTKSAIGCE